MGLFVKRENDVGGADFVNAIILPIGKFSPIRFGGYCARFVNVEIRRSISERKLCRSGVITLGRKVTYRAFHAHDVAFFGFPHVVVESRAFESAGSFQFEICDRVLPMSTFALRVDVDAQQNKGGNYSDILESVSLQDVQWLIN